MTQRWASAFGLAWSPSGDEVWFTATATGFSRSLRGVSLSGNLRELLSAPGTLTLHDAESGGRALISRDAMRAGAIGLAPGENKECDLSWQDWTVPFDLSTDGKHMLFTEAGGGGDYAVFTRDTSGASAAHLGPGFQQIALVDTDTGEWNERCGWVPVDQTVRNTAMNALRGSLEKKDYLTMPMSTLFLFNRPQDYGFAHAEPVRVAMSRNHQRVSKSPYMVAGRPLWCVAATHDIGFERDQRNNGPTHTKSILPSTANGNT